MFRFVVLFTACWMTCGQSLCADEPDPRLQKIRDHWKSAPAEINSFRLRGRRFTYDRVFEVEKRAEFEIAWERDGRLISRIESAKIPDSEVSQRKNPKGEHYRLESDVDEIWNFPSREQDREFIDPQVIIDNKIVLPADSPQTWDEFFALMREIARNSPEFLRSAFNPGLGRFALEREWKITREASGHLFLHSEIKNSSFSEIELCIRESDSELVAVKIIDPTGNRETVYRFDERETNPGFAKEAPVFDIKRDQLKFTNDGQPKASVEPKISTDSADNSETPRRSD